MARRRQVHRRPGHSPRQRSAPKKPNTLGLRILLIGALILLAFLLLRRVPPGLAIMASIAIFIVFLLLMALWLTLRYRLTPEEKQFYAEQGLKAVQLEETAQVIGMRPVEREDLRHLGDKEFEYFTGALLEAMGILHDWECIGKGGDHGIDLRGKNQYNQTLVVQCKRFFGHNVGPDKTRDFGWTLTLHEAHEAWFVTTSFFSDQARKDVKPLTIKGHMKLIDGDALVGFIHDHWDALPATWQWRLTECQQQRA